MKKVLSFVLVLSMILGSFGMAFAAPAADTVGMECEDAVNVLTELGVVAGYKDGTYRPENVVTRAEMATFIIKAMGLADYAVGKSEFSDMAGHWADPFVAYAVSLGFVKGNTDGTFAPDATVSYDQAITMLVQALGYKAEYLTGGYPGAFVNQAKTLGMLDGVKSGAAGANRGDVAVLLFNTLPARFVRYDADGKLDNVVLSGQRYDNMLTRLGVDAVADAFVVDGEEEAVIKMKDYQGAYVTAYEKDEEIIAIEEVKSVFLTGEFDIDATTAVAALTSGAVEFVADDVTYTIKADAVSSAAFKTFIDGAEDNTLTTVTDAATYTMGVKVSGKKIVNLYSISTWEAEATIQWTEDLAEALAEDDKFDNEAFVMNDNDEIDLDSFVLVGADTLEDIEEDAVVTYYLDKNDKIAKIEVSTTVVEGKITKEKTGQVYIGSKYYKVNGNTDEALTAGSGDLDLSCEGKFFLDYAGKIAFTDVTGATADDYAVVIQVENGQGGLRAEDALIKVVLADGSVKTYAFDEDALKAGDIQSTSVPGTTVGAIDAVEAGFATGVAIKFNLNKDGKVDMVTGVALTTNAAMDVTAKGTYNGHKLAADVVVLAVANMNENGYVLSDDTDDYSVVARTALLGQKDVVAKYELNDKGEIIFMLVKQDGVTGTHAWTLVTGFATLEDDLYEVTFVDGKTYTTEDNSWVNTTLYAIDFDVNGYVKDETSNLTGDDVLRHLATISTGGSITRVAGNKVYTGSTYTYAITLDDEVVVYKWNAEDAAYEASEVSKIKGHKYDVEFYDIDNDLVADIVLLK